MALASQVAPDPAAPPVARGADYRRLLVTYLGPHRARGALLFALMTADIGLDLVGPQIQRAFIDQAVAGAPMSALTRLALTFLGVAFSVQLLFVAEKIVATDLAQRATNALREDLLARALHLDLGWHEARTPGELIERIDGDVATLGTFLSRFLFEMVGSAMLVTGVLVLLFRIDVRIGAALALFAVVALLAMRRLLGVAARRWTASREADAQLFGLLEERLAGTEDVRANGAVAYVLRRFLERARLAFRARLRAAAVGSATGGASILLLATGVALALAVGVLLYREGTITIGTVYLLLSYSLLLEGPINSIARQLQDLQRAGAGVARVGELLATESAIAEPPADVATTLPAGPLAVEVHDVTFAYGDGPPVLRDVRLALAPGTSLGLVGRTGCGKSTLAKLLLRLHDVEPDHGAVRLAGLDLRGVATSSLRARTAMVTQEVQLFHGTLRDNLTLFDGAVPDERLRAVLEELGLGPWLAAQPEGLATPLAPGGAGLSAGEAQLVAFARVLLGDPGLVILDEASSRLDPDTERRLEAAVGRLVAGRTVVLVAHRLSTLRHVDRVAVMEAGRVVEEGERRALERDPASRWSRLLATGAEDVERAAAALAGAGPAPDEDRSAGEGGP